MSGRLDAFFAARSMTPEERARFHAIASGFGEMLMANHRAESEAFAARWPGLVRLRWGYPRLDGGWSRSRRFFSVELTREGMRAAFYIEANGLPKAFPKLASEEAGAP